VGEGKRQVRKFEAFEYVVVDARDAFYRARLEKFLGAVAKHFQGERDVTLVDLRGFGLWGEWHSGFRYASLEERQEALCGVIDCWVKAFPKQWLALSYSFDPDGPAELHAGPTDRMDETFTSGYKDYLKYSAFDHALTKSNVTLRRDGVGGAVHSNERKLCEEAFATLSKGPMSCEFVQGYAEAKAGGEKWINAMLDDALTLHPNYINVLGYCGGDALAFVREQRGIFEHGAREMGYRLVPTRVTYPKKIRSGDDFEAEMAWVNRGVGRAMRDFHGVFLVVDEKGKEIARCDAGGTGADRWVKGSSYEVRKKVRFEKLAGGKYALRVGLLDGERWIAMPLKSGDGKTYPLGEIEFERE
jgi:hypothetical protein